MSLEEPSLLEKVTVASAFTTPMLERRLTPEWMQGVAECKLLFGVVDSFPILLSFLPYFN